MTTDALPPRPIALLGLRCAGKTTVGRLLAERTGRAFRDLDDETLAFAGRAGFRAPSIGALLATAGQARFRELEAAALRPLLEPQPRIVLATGGGVVERADNRTWLARAATCVWLDVPLDVLVRRLRADPAARPPLEGGPDAAAELATLRRRRAPWYAALAAITIEAGERGADELANEVRDRLVELAR